MSCPRTLPRKKTRGSSEARTQDPWITSQTPYHCATWDPPVYKLNLQRLGSEVVHLAAFGAESKTVGHFDTARVYPITDHSEKIAIDVLIVPTIAVPVRNQIRATAHLPYLQGLKLGHSVSKDDIFHITLLIGVNKYWEIIEDHVIRGDGPTAVQSKIRFLLSGQFTLTSSPKTTDYIMNVILTPPSSEDTKRFWKLESIGIQPSKEEQVSSYLESYKTNCINFNNGRYTASLPWKPDQPDLPDNDTGEKAVKRPWSLSISNMYEHQSTNQPTAIKKRKTKKIMSEMLWIQCNVRR